MRRIMLAGAAFALSIAPALAAEASEPVTWGAVAAIAGWIGLGLLGLVAVAVILLILFAAIGGFNDWSH